ncbi:Golgin candidate 4 [Linum perenne]
MWSSLENLKQNLNKIALDVHDDDDDELDIYAFGNGSDSSVSDRRNSHSSAHANSVSPSHIANGVDSPCLSEIDQYESEIRRLRESEAEIKALSVNYAALLKEKEDQISRLNREKGVMKQNLDATKEALNAYRTDNSRASPNNSNGIKRSGEQSPKKPNKLSPQAKNRYAGSYLQNGVSSKLEGLSNGMVHERSDSGSSKLESQRELADLLEEKSRSMEAMQASHDLKIKQLTLELEEERGKSANVQQKLQEEHKLNESFQEELRMLQLDKHKATTEFSRLQTELNGKLSEMSRLQMELTRQGDENADDKTESLNKTIENLKRENIVLKVSKKELEAALEKSTKSSVENIVPDRMVDPSISFPEKKELEASLQKLERDLREARSDKERALQELNRLKQHLLEKESEESEKMDHDSEIIEELRQTNEYQKAQISHLEKALKQAIANHDDIRMQSNNEILKSKEMIEDLNRKLAECMSTIEYKNVEILNLQTALGQYYAEVEAKEHLERQLALAREESAKLSAVLKDVEQGSDALKKEKEEIIVKLSNTEMKLEEGRKRVNKLEEDNAILRHAVEQNMTRLNRMSLDSDFLVDRRIVIKLLVTYFQRNHSKEVLDLMVRMLGFSDEDKQRIGVAQQGGKGVVRGVLGLPGRFVGGFLGGGSADANANANAASENQSFADLWVDFLLKENEERERRESSTVDAGKSPTASAGTSTSSSTDHIPSTGNQVPGISRPSFGSSVNYNGPQRHYEQSSDSEFSTVPLTSLDSKPRLPRFAQQH